MSDAFWISLAGTIIAATGLVNSVSSFLTARRIGRVEKKTDEQTKVIQATKTAAEGAQTAATGAQSAATDASEHANGAFKRLEERLDTAQQARVDDLKEGRDKAVDALKDSAPASAVSAASVAPPAARIEVQVTAVPPATPPAPAAREPGVSRTTDPKPPGGTL